jgi:hypothetical protein
MQTTFHAHRSGHETLWNCPRQRYLAYHHLGTGIAPQTPLYFDVGLAVHKGLQTFMQYIADGADDSIAMLCSQNQAQADAIDYFNLSDSYKRLTRRERLEQMCLVSGLLWSFYYRLWPAMRNDWHILAVEEPWVDAVAFNLAQEADGELNIHSRPDLIARNRTTGEVAVWNWKTQNTLDPKRRVETMNGLQVLLERHYAELIFNRWNRENWVPDIPKGMKGDALRKYLDEQRAAPVQVDYTQLVYFVKGNRGPEESGTTDLEGDGYNPNAEWFQDSFLCYRWLNLKTGNFSWSYRHYKDGNVSFSTLTPKKEWVKVGVWEALDLDETVPVQDCASALVEECRDWVQSLCAGEVYPSTNHGEDGRNALNPLDSVVVLETPVARNPRREESAVRQFTLQEIGVANALVQIGQLLPSLEYVDDSVAAATFKFGLDALFPQYFTGCRRHVKCAFEGHVCNHATGEFTPPMGVEELGALWKLRVPHHEGERVAIYGDGSSEQ